MQTHNIQATGSIPEIVRNDAQLYESDLIPYFRILFRRARNLRAPYHNARHMLHVFYMCYRAIVHYRIIGQPFSEREARNLLVAALFHDFDHTARGGNDDINIVFAIRGFREHVLDEDRHQSERIVQLIGWTEYPYKMAHEHLDELGLVLRDADMSQAMSTAWIQQVVFGLAEEWGKPAMEVLKMQIGFHKGLKFYSHWGKTQFSSQLIQSKVAEAEQLVEILGV